MLTKADKRLLVKLTKQVEALEAKEKNLVRELKNLGKKLKIAVGEVDANAYLDRPEHASSRDWLIAIEVELELKEKEDE